ncbi:MAG: signal peptide peptidase SppA [Puniceicoccales bacterium]|jgi:protease-4|nr:signal peptide peptidase SppA [Puniceicoccales bacterium]
MKNFLSNLCTAALGNLIAGTIFFFFSCTFLAFLIIVIIANAESGQRVSVPNKAFLVLNLSMVLSDTPDQHSGALRSFVADEPKQMGLWDLCTALDAAAKDSRIHGLFITGDLHSDGYGSGYAALAELRRAINGFKTKGKPVFAYLDEASLKNYYVATTADTLYLNPYASLGIRGLSSQSPYLATAFAKYGIGVQTTKVGKYKSAVEPFISDKMSDADREQRQMLLNELWDSIVNDIATSRNVAPPSILALASKATPLTANLAITRGLADKVAYLDEVIDTLKLSGAPDLRHDSFAQISISAYSQHLHENEKAHSSSVVAIVYAEGDIMDGNVGNANSIAGNNLAATLRQLRQDSDVAAIVLRVNSPGGSATASEVIQREVRQLRAEGKPIVISMGSLAASGGYWISAFGDSIFAEKTTITGSIGVFGIMFNVQDAARNVGIHFDGVKTSPFADLKTIVRPKTPGELALLQEHTDTIYDAFLDKVAEGRKRRRADIAKIAEGRIWSGAKAIKLGLVDQIGGLREAVKDAATRGNVANHYTVRQYPERRTVWELISQGLSQPEDGPPIIRATGQAVVGLPPSRAHSPMSRVLRQAHHTISLLEKFNDRNGVHARLQYWVEEE